jgi:hypothetical protein
MKPMKLLEVTGSEGVSSLAFEFKVPWRLPGRRWRLIADGSKLQLQQ